MDSAAWDERYAASELVWSAGPNQFVEQALAELPPGRALDLACGEGRNARWLAERGWRVTAMDFSPVAVEKGRRLSEQVADRIDWVVGDVLAATLPTGVDLVLLAYLQVVPAERGAVVRRAFDSLAPGGRLLVVAHDSTNLTEGEGGPQDPSVLYTADDVVADLDGRRFEIIRAGRIARGPAWDAMAHVLRGS